MSLEIKLRKLRERKGWSQMKVALQLNISQPAYNKWETGQTKPTLQNLHKIAEIFEIDFYDLIKEQISNVGFSNSSFGNNSDNPTFVIKAMNTKINYDLPDLIAEILENQQQMVKLMESQSKLIKDLLKK